MRYPHPPLERYIKIMQDEGWRLSLDVAFENHAHKTMCPIGAVALAGDVTKQNPYGQASNLIGVALVAFTDGFDGNYDEFHEEGIGEDDSFDLGQAYRYMVYCKELQSPHIVV